jgi:hypothetical protein
MRGTVATRATHTKPRYAANHPALIHRMASRLALAAFFFVCACRLPGSQPGCDSVAIDWVNFIEVGSTQYLWGTVEAAELQVSDLGPVYARVKFKVSDNVCDPNYRLKDGDAAFLEPGTPIYQVKGQPASEQLAARFNGHILLYVVVVKSPPPPSGSSPSP